jgi:hypothetical protein
VTGWFCDLPDLYTIIADGTATGLLGYFHGSGRHPWGGGVHETEDWREIED